MTPHERSRMRWSLAGCLLGGLLAGMGVGTTWVSSAQRGLAQDAQRLATTWEAEARLQAARAELCRRGLLPEGS